MRRPHADERELWRRAMRDVRPLPGRDPAPEQIPDRRHPAGPSEDACETPAVPAPQRRPQPNPPLAAHAGIDRATAGRLRRGRLPVEATLDLHGMTQDEAHRALSRLIA